MLSSARDCIERTVSGFGFSVLCFLIWGGLTALRARHLVDGFSWMEFIWLVYIATFAVLFLVRSRPTAVSLNPLHWVVALLVSFSGMFFENESAGIAGTEAVANGVVLLGIVGSGTAALALRRSYDFLPALRGVTTDWLFRFIRHPMYVSSILIRLGYLGMHASMYNVAIFTVMVGLYVKRVDYEEDIMQRDERYIEYMRQVRYRFLPGIY